jgi:polar amino acid transport system substrate-binding protein
MRALVAGFLWAMGNVGATSAQTLPSALRVVTFAIAPFAMEQGDSWVGFSIEIWEEIAARLKTKTVYRGASSLVAAFDALRSNDADILVSGLYITAERDREFDFSYTIVEAGQQIMVLDTGDTTHNPLLDLLELLFSRTSLVWLAIAILLLLVPAHAIWLLERRNKGGIISTKRYLPGILDALHWSASTLMTQADRTPHYPLSRVVSFLWMFVSIVFVALYTAQLTTNLTVKEIRGSINGPNDLPGKRVGTLKNSISADYLRGHGAKLHEFDHFDDMVKALIERRVDAVMLGAPPLLRRAPGG